MVRLLVDLNSRALTHLSASLISCEALPRMKTSRTQTRCISVPTRCIAVRRARPGLLGEQDRAMAEGGLCLREMAGDGTSLESLQVHALTLFSG